jgi:hypothetical protein
LNGGTTRGGAFGFKIDILPKLSAVKAVDNKLSVIDYVVMLLDNSRGTANVVANLEHVRAVRWCRCTDRRPLVANFCAL